MTVHRAAAFHAFHKFNMLFVVFLSEIRWIGAPVKVAFVLPTLLAEFTGASVNSKPGVRMRVLVCFVLLHLLDSLSVFLN